MGGGSGGKPDVVKMDVGDGLMCWSLEWLPLCLFVGGLLLWGLGAVLVLSLVFPQLEGEGGRSGCLCVWCLLNGWRGVH